MEDSGIVELFWQRSEEAVPAASRKYGRYCRAVADNILRDPQDSEECVNDTWLGAWNSMPDARPALLKPYLARLTRWLALDRLRKSSRMKRGGGEVSLALEELDGYPASGSDVEAELEQRELSAALERFLSRLNREERAVFVSRYWYFCPVSDIARRMGYSDSKTKSMLYRLRQRLANYLKGEGLC